MAAVEKAEDMNPWVPVCVIATLWAAMPAAVASTDPPGTEARQGPQAEKPKAEKNRQPTKRPNENAGNAFLDTSSEATLCDGVPFGPADTPDSSGGRR